MTRGAAERLQAELIAAGHDASFISGDGPRAYRVVAECSACGRRRFNGWAVHAGDCARDVSTVARARVDDVRACLGHLRTARERARAAGRRQLARTIDRAMRSAAASLRRAELRARGGDRG